MTITFWFVYGSQNPQHKTLSWAELHTGKMWCESVHNFWSFTGQIVILYRWSIWNGNGNGSSWLVVHFQVLLNSIDLTWRHVAKSSHLAANVMTDRHTHRHTDTQTHRQTEWRGKKHNTFFQRYKYIEIVLNVQTFMRGMKMLKNTFVNQFSLV